METNKITFKHWKRAYEAPSDPNAPSHGFRTLPESDTKIEIEFYTIHKSIFTIGEYKYSVKFSDSGIGSVFKVHDKDKKLVAQYFRLQKWLFVGELKLVVYNEKPHSEWISNYIKFRRKNHRLTNSKESIEYSIYKPSLRETLRDYFARTIVEVECTKSIDSCSIEICLGFMIGFAENNIHDKNYNH